MYSVILKNKQWWIQKDDVILKEIGGFDDPISPEILLEAIQDEI